MFFKNHVSSRNHSHNWFYEITVKPVTRGQPKGVIFITWLIFFTTCDTGTAKRCHFHHLAYFFYNLWHRYSQKVSFSSLGLFFLQPVTQVQPKGVIFITWLIFFTTCDTGTAKRCHFHHLAYFFYNLWHRYSQKVSFSSLGLFFLHKSSLKKQQWKPKKSQKLIFFLNFKFIVQNICYQICII